MNKKPSSRLYDYANIIHDCANIFKYKNCIIDMNEFCIKRRFIMDNLSEIAQHFDLAYDAESYGNGHINDTYLISGKQYIMQRINTNIFKNPDEVMDNIVKITSFLRKKLAAEGGDPDRETMTVIPTTDGKSFYKTPEGNCYRVYKFISNAVSYDVAENSNQLYEAARAFGKFQRLLSDFPAAELHETIPHFHDTYKRFRDLKDAISSDVMHRADGVQKEIEFALGFENDTKLIGNLTESGEIPARVTHNDTKLNNVMLEAGTDKGLCVIDLDTVMPGSLLFDYGDALRTGAATAAEDEKNLDKMHFDLNLFEAFTKGFLEEMGSSITKKEVELLPFSAKIITFECGIRFLTDYLSGDTYFKTAYPEHNLDRTRTQFKLVSEIEQKTPEMTAIIEKYIK